MSDRHARRRHDSYDNTHSDDRRGRGQAADYYDNHPAASRTRSRRRRRHDDDYYSSSSDDDRPSPPRARSRRGRSHDTTRPSDKVTQAIDHLETGNFRGALDVIRHHPRSRSAVSPPASSRAASRHRRRRNSSPSPVRHSRTARGSSRSRSSNGREKSSFRRWQYAAGAAAAAGAVEAYRVRHEPGKWVGPKGARVVTAAIGAGSVKAVVGSVAGGGFAPAAVAGLVMNKLIGGSSRRERSR